MRWLVLGCCLLFAAPSAALAQQQAVSADLLRLHDALHLSTEQEAAWRTYTIAIAPNPQADARHRAAEELLPQVPTPRRVALIEATMAGDLADFRHQGEAVSVFYGQLSAGQQRTFDIETLPSNQSRPAGTAAAPQNTARPR